MAHVGRDAQRHTYRTVEPGLFRDGGLRERRETQNPGRRGAQMAPFGRVVDRGADERHQRRRGELAAHDYRR